MENGWKIKGRKMEVFSYALIKNIFFSLVVERKVLYLKKETLLLVVKWVGKRDP